jgi:hypothetical protein
MAALSGASPNGAGGAVAGAAPALRESVEEIGRAARREGIELDDPLGILLGAIGRSMLGLADITERLEKGTFTALADARSAAEVDLERLRAGVTAAGIALNQAKAAQSVLEVQRETLVSRMVGDIAPRIAASLKDLLVIRERRLNRNLQTRRYAVVGAVTLALVGGGDALRAVQDRNATEAFSRCYAAQVVDQATGKAYCALDAILR